MTIQVQSADGVIHQFPDGTNPAVIDGAMKTYAEQAKARAKPQGLTQQVTGFMANVNRGLGIGDEMAAGFRTAGNLFAGKIPLRPYMASMEGAPDALRAIGDDFSSNLSSQRRLEAGYQQQHPNMAALARGTGMAATAAVPVGNTANVFAQGSRLANATRGATMAGIQGAAYSAVDAGTPAERLKAASETARNPFVLGLGALGGALATPGKPKAVPLSRDQLEAARTGAYDQVRDANVTYTPDAYNRLSNNITAATADKGFNPGIHKDAAAMLDDIHARGGRAVGYAPSLPELDQLRQQIGLDVASSPKPGEARMGQIMRGQIDNFVNTATPADLAPGASLSPSEAADLINTARGLNTRLAKVDAISEAAGLADRRAAKSGSGGNIDNVLRQNMDKLLSNISNWTPEERQALDNIVMGGRGQNLLRLIGKMSPSGNGLHALLNTGGTITGAIAGGAAAGPMGAGAGAAVGGAPALAGVISKLAADGITRSKVAQLIAQISTLPGSTAPGVAALSGPAAARLSRVAGVAGAALQSRPANMFADPGSP